VRKGLSFFGTAQFTHTSTISKTRTVHKLIGCDDFLGRAHPQKYMDLVLRHVKGCINAMSDQYNETYVKWENTGVCDKKELRVGMHWVSLVCCSIPRKWFQPFSRLSWYDPTGTARTADSLFSLVSFPRISRFSFSSYTDVSKYIRHKVSILEIFAKPENNMCIT